jgi:hypothetical protein
MEAVHLNTLAAIGQLQGGDVTGARTRLGEGAAVALRVLETPLLAPYGYHMLRNDVLLPFAVLAEAEGKPEEARALRAAREALAAQRPDATLGMAGLAAEAPEMRGFARIVIQSPLPKGERVGLLLAGWDGLCGNPREILSGPSDARSARLSAIADSIGSPHARELLAIARRRWVGSATTGRDGNGFLARLANRGPGTVTGRVLRCTVRDYPGR